MAHRKHGLGRARLAGIAVALLVWLLLGASGPMDCAPVPVECTSSDCACEAATRGVIITEILPSYFAEGCPGWFEVYNGTDRALDLSGWRVSDPTESTEWVIPAGEVSLAAGDTAIFGAIDGWSRGAERCGYFPSASYWDSGFSLGRYTGGIVLRDASGLLQDAVVWDLSWGFVPQVSMELQDLALDNGLRESWALATERMGLEEEEFYGTPRSVPPSDGGPAGPCDDGNSCTRDYCDQQMGCTHVPTDAPCDDGDPCTVEDRCDAWLGGQRCGGGSARDCDDGDPCTADWCDPSFDGGCRHRTVTPCSDALPCTPTDEDACPTLADPCFAYACDKERRCHLVPTTAPCDDGDPCTVQDRCEDGRCHGLPPERYPPCETPELFHVWEGLCAPELGGVAYPFLYWIDDEGNYHWSGMDWCDDYHSPCGEIVAWPFFHGCVLLVH